MSADNYYRISKHPNNPEKFAISQGFASNEELVEPNSKSPEFDDILSARRYILDNDPIIEYGIHVDNECLAVLDQRNVLER